MFTSYLQKYLRVLIETSTSYSFYCCCYRRAPRGRYSCIAQGASPGLIIGIHLLSPVGVALPIRRANARAVSAAPTELNLILSVCTQGSISGFALIPPWAMRECRPYRAHCRIGCLRCCVVVLCSLNVFGCVNGLLCLVVYLFDFDCIVCGIGGIDLCGRAMSPNGAILLQSPGRKPWVNYCNTFIEPLQGRHFLTQGCVWSLCCIYSLGHWLAWVSAAPCRSS